MFGIILAAVALVLCTLTAINDLVRDHFGGALVFGLLAALNLVILIFDINEYKKKDQPQVHVVKEVKEYYVDSTTVINGADTTKTYILTYIK